MCPESVSRSHDPDRHGNCRWCDRKVGPPVARPTWRPSDGTELGDAYGYFYDPDYGVDD